MVKLEQVTLIRSFKFSTAKLFLNKLHISIANKTLIILYIF